MLVLYVITGIIGLGLIILSALGGFGAEADFDADASVDFDSHVEIDASHDFDSGHDFDHGHDLTHGADIWLPFFSLRFWTYLLGGFGGFGLLLSLIGVNQEPIRLISAIIAGLITGLSAAYAMRYFQRNNLNSSISDKDFLGAAARVTVSPSENNPGKVRLFLKDETIDVLALPLEGHTITSGDEVVVVSVNGAYVTVANTEQYMNN
jgi:membrane protein implicated in regulation of membrane protease activity